MTIRINWGTGIAAIYTAFALATTGFVYFAMRQPVELVSPDYYAASLQHDARMAATANAHALGERLAVDVDAAGRTIAIAWPEEQRASLAGRIVLYRPSDAAADRSLRIAPGADGRQIVTLTGLAPGHWVLKLEWQAAGRSYYAERAVVAR
jgi:YD repeat-containing protein